jgi:hypothetical protein
MRVCDPPPPRGRRGVSAYSAYAYRYGSGPPREERHGIGRESPLDPPSPSYLSPLKEGRKV